MIPLIFLDIDGVLNDHELHEYSGCCGILPRCAHNLNIILQKTNANLVICSAWRYMISNGAMTVRGFDYLLRTHGINAENRIDGYTPLDEQKKGRGMQITHYLIHHYKEFPKYVVLDDVDDDITNHGHPFVKTNGKVGLTDEDSEKAVQMLL